MAFNNIPPNGFPALPDVEDLEAVVKDVTSLKTSVAGLTEDVGDLNDNKANQITIAPFFSAETSYEVGDLVYYNGLSYRCTNAHEGEWDADDFAATTIAGELATVKSGLTNAAKTVYRDFHRIEPGGSYGFNLTLEENHAYIVAICSGNNDSWGYCGIMLKGWVSFAAVLSDIYKGTYITVTVDNTDSIEVSNTETTYTASCEIMVIDLGRGQQPS